jgi:hypothetical protein
MRTNVFGQHFRKLSPGRMRKWKDNFMNTLREAGCEGGN